MSATETKIRCPKCHGRFFVPIAEIGRDNTTPCPNCGTRIAVKAKSDGAAKAPQAKAAVETPDRAADAPIAASAAAAVEPRPWWKFWRR